MIRGLATAVSGMVTQEAKQDVITNNIANAETIGYKQDNLAIKSFKEVLIQNFDKISGGKNVQNIIGSLSLGSQIDGTNTNFTPGLIENTGKSTDFAIDGPGFFTVTSTANGNSQSFYTRDGSFGVDSKGYLITSNGDNVMGTNLTTQKVEPIKVNNATITTDANNNICLNGTKSYKFQMADFDKYSSLKKVGDNLYNGAVPNKNQTISVKQNSLEKSNVNVMSEMINMMTVLRNYESDQKVIQTIDETLGKAVNEVGAIK